MYACARVCACIYRRASTKRGCMVTSYMLMRTEKEKQTVFEKDIVKAILKYLRTVPRCFCWKEHGGMYGTAGIPDIIACVDGRFYGFEVKTEDGKPTKLQEATIRRICASGGTAAVVRCVEEVRWILAHANRHEIKMEDTK